MLREIGVSLPPQIADLVYRTPRAVVSQIETATTAVVAVDSSDPNHIEALSGLLLRIESVASSKIEEIEASIEDFARASAGVRTNEAATSMVIASRALSKMIAKAGDGAILLGDILDAHRTSMIDDPIDGPHAGRLRTHQNWIGGSDYSPIGAVHIPPPPEMVEAYMDDLLAFANRNDTPAIAQAAIVHAQFESIHPFTDGNGRIGRALINAVLRRRGIARNVVIPIASAMVAERDNYFSLMNDYRAGDIDSFVFNLAVCTEVAATGAAEAAERLGEIPEYWATISNPRAGSAAAQILALLTTHPVLSAEDVTNLISAPLSSIYTALERLERDGVIHQVTNRQRNRVWGATEVLAELDRLGGRIAERMRERLPLAIARNRDGD
jgi:Fic family protein